MHTPLFSILLPTRGRAQLLQHALLSVQAQDFDDYEVIVSDGSADVTAESAYWTRCWPQLDGRFHYRRAGDVWMAENWQQAFAVARGRYVLVLQDKAELTRGALSALAAAISQAAAPEALTFHFDGHPEPAAAPAAEAWRNPVARSPSALAWQPYPRDPEYPVQELLRDGWSGFYQAQSPRLINSVVRRDFALRLADRCGAFFIGPDPDVMSALLQLDQLDSFFGTPFGAVSFAMPVAGATLGNGLQTSTSLDAAIGNRLRIPATHLEGYRRMPLADLPLFHNYLFFQWLRAQTLACNRLLRPDIKLDLYWRMIQRDIATLAAHNPAVDWASFSDRCASAVAQYAESAPRAADGSALLRRL